jgi:hypothetical protein
MLLSLRRLVHVREQSTVIVFVYDILCAKLAVSYSARGWCIMMSSPCVLASSDRVGRVRLAMWLSSSSNPQRRRTGRVIAC